MKQLYGAATFCAAYGDRPNPMWTAAISRLTDDECRKGFERLAKESREYPCNLTQFVAACHYSPGVRHLGVVTTSEALQKALPPPHARATPETVNTWLAKMRQKLGRSSAPKSEHKVDIFAGACTCKAMGECDVCKRYQ